MGSKSIAILLGLVLIGLGGWFLSQSRESPATNVQATWVNATEDMIKLDLVRPGVMVLQKFTVSGQARGLWYFEASFPVEVIDKGGKRLDIEPAQAQEEWMTEEFVPFRVELDLGSYNGDATLILRKDNPSGEPERDASVSFPIVVFDPNK